MTTIDLQPANTASSVAVIKADDIPSPVAEYVTANPGSVVTNPKVRDRFLKEIEEEIEQFYAELEPLDLSNKATRQAIASKAYKVSQTKSPIERAADALTEDWKKQTKVVVAEKKAILSELDRLRDLARLPLNKWEEEEAKREDKLKEDLDFLDDARVFLSDDTSAILKRRLLAVEAIDGDADRVEAKVRTMAALTNEIARLERIEADRAELDALRAEKAAREAAEDARKRQEAEAKEAAERAERDRVAGHKQALALLDSLVNDACSPFNSTDRIKHIRGLFETSDANYRDWQEFRASYEALVASGRQRIEARISEVLAAEEESKRKIEAAAQAEAERKIAEAIEAESRASAKRAADEHHRAQVIEEVIESFQQAGISAPKARKLVAAILGGAVKHVKIEF